MPLQVVDILEPVKIDISLTGNITMFGSYDIARLLSTSSGGAINHKRIHLQVSTGCTNSTPSWGTNLLMPFNSF